MPLDPKRAAAASARRFKEPLMISGYEVTASRLAVVGDNQPRTSAEMVVRTIETIGDLARLDAHMKTGRFIPVPDMGIQALNIVIDKLDMLEPEKKEDEDGA